METLNPALEKTFLFGIPRSKRHMVHGMVLMQHRVTTVGTWRLHRDEFNEVTRVQLLDQYSVAAAEFRKRFGADVPPEKSASTRTNRAQFRRLAALPRH